MKTDNFEHAQEVRWCLSYAVGYFQLGMMQEASDELDKLPMAWHEKPEVLSLKGQIFLTQERWEDVINHASKASLEYPEMPEFYIQAALAFDKLGLEYPEMPEFYIQAALAFDKLGQPDDARAVWLAAPKEIRVTPFYHYNLARCEARLGHFALARQHVRAVMTLAPAMREVLARDPGLLAFVQEPMNN